MIETPIRAHARVITTGIGVTMVAALAFAPSGVLAETDDVTAEPVRVRLDGPAGCPDGARFFDELRARTRRVRAATGDEPARLFRVTLAGDGGAVGTLVIEEPARSTRPRTVRGASCEEVVTALSLAAALAIDPHASMDLGPTGRTPGDADSGAPVDDASGAPALLDASAPDGEPDAAAVSPPASAVPLGTPPPPAPGWRYTAGALFDVVGAAAPGAVVGASAFVRADRDADALFGPTLRLGVAAYGDRSVAAAPGSGRFTWWVGQLDACPVRLSIGARLRTDTCAAVEIGALVATGSGVTNEQSHTRPWISAGGVERLEWRIHDLVAIEAYAGLRAPITREAFVFNPSTSVYTPPPLTLVGGMGLGVSFP